MDRAQSALVALRQILQATEFNARAFAKAGRLAPSHLLLLQLLRGEAQVTHSRAARVMSLGPATMTAIVQKMEARGLIVRQPDPTDKRRIFLRLTEEGRRVLDEGPDPLQSRFASAFDALPDWEQGYLVAALERVATMLASDSPRGAGPARNP